MAGVPELDMLWWRFSIKARGKDAIDAIRKPLFVLLLMNAALTMLVAILAAVQPQWSTMKDVVAYWAR